MLSNKRSTNQIHLNGVQEVVGSNPAGPSARSDATPIEDRLMRDPWNVRIGPNGL